MSDWAHDAIDDLDEMRERIASQDAAMGVFFEWERLERDHPWFRALTLPAQYMVAAEVAIGGVEVPHDADIGFFRNLARRVVDAHVAWGVEK